MAGDFILQAAQKAMEAGIKECSKNYDESPQRALDLISEAAKTIGRYFRNQPTIRSEVLGESLFDAAMQGRVDAVELLKDRGAHPDWRDAGGKSALQKLALEVKDSEDMMRTMIGVGADVNALVLDERGQRLLHAVVTNEKLGSLEVLLECGVDVNMRTDNSLRETALHIVAKRDCSSTSKTEGERRHTISLKLTEALLDADANPLQQDAQDLLPVHRAILSKNNEQMALRLLQGIKYPQNTLNGLLLMSIFHDRGSMIDPLIAAGADVRAEWNGRSMLQLASDRPTSQASETLLRRVASLITQAQVGEAMASDEPQTAEQPAQTASLPSPL